MDYQIINLLHVLGFTVLGAGLIGIFIADLRARQFSTLSHFSEAVNLIRIFSKNLVLPGVLTVFATGFWMVSAKDMSVGSQPWLLGMLVLSAKFVVGMVVTRIYFTRLSRLCQSAIDQGLQQVPELRDHRAARAATFIHFNDLPLFFTVVFLGVLRPADWPTFVVSLVTAVLLAVVLNWLVPRALPWKALSDDTAGRSPMPVAGVTQPG